MRNIFEAIAKYAVKKILGYFVKKYNLKDYVEAILHIEDKDENPKR
jgi:dissimilatory sulfite reductase (desulfoviridin) alpha/beta subunit